MHTFTVTVAGGTTTNVSAVYAQVDGLGVLSLTDASYTPLAIFAAGQWLKVVRS